MTYLFLGQDLTAKNTKIAEIKKKVCPSPEALKFDCETLYAQKLGPDELKKALIALPAVSKERLIIIKECHKLTAQNKELILELIRNPGPCILLLDSEKWDKADAFVKKLSRTAKILQFKTETPLDVFSLTRLISMGKPA